MCNARDICNLKKKLLRQRLSVEISHKVLQSAFMMKREKTEEKLGRITAPGLTIMCTAIPR